jgi:hypothetical protein
MLEPTTNCRPSDDSHSSQDSAQSDYASEDEAGYEMDTPDTDSDDAREGDSADSVWLLADNNHSTEYHIRHWQEGNDEKDEEKDYATARLATITKHEHTAARRQVGKQNAGTVQKRWWS